MTEQKDTNFKDARITRHRTVDGDQGRIETRTTTAIHDIAWLQQRHDWPGLNGVVMVESIRETSGAGAGIPKIEHEARFYITSLVAPAQLGAGRAQPLGRGEQPPLGPGYDLPGR